MPKQKSTEDLKQEKIRLIHRTAVKVFSKKGFYKSRISDIITEAKIAYGLYYHYFKSKDDILIYIFETAWLELLKQVNMIVEKNPDPVKQLESILDYCFGIYTANPDLLKVLIMDVPRLNKFYEKKYQKIYISFFQKIADIIRFGQDMGHFSKKISAEIAANMLIASIDVTIRQKVYNPELMDDKTDFKMISANIMNILKFGILK